MGMLIREFFDKICDMFKGVINFFKKHSKKDEDLKYEFLPSALEIIEKPASPLGKAIILIISVFMLAVLIWSSVAQIDVTIVSSGSIVPVDGVKVVDSNVNGEIVSINKSEGDVVKEGEEILVLENIDGDFEEEDMESELKINKLNLDIVNAKIHNTYSDEVYSAYSDIDSNKIEEIKLQESLESNKREEDYNSYLKNIQDIENKISELEKEIREVTNKYETLQQGADDIYLSTLLDTIKRDKDEIESLKKEKEDAIKNRKEEEESYELSMIKERNQYEEKIKDLEAKIEALKNNNSKYTIKSPVDGIILTSNYNTVGSYINQSKAVAEIISDDSELEIETYIPNKDIARIEKGQNVVIKVEAYNYQKYGTLNGTIEYISPSAIVNEDLGVVYKVKIKFDKEQNKNIKILPGMTTTLEIKSGKKKIIEYFLESFEKTIDNALKG